MESCGRMIHYLFVAICILIMWPMLFSVPVLYASSTRESTISIILVMTTLELMVAFLAWITFGYPLSFQASGKKG